MTKLWGCVFLFALTPLLFAQGELDRLVAESVRLRGVPQRPSDDALKSQKKLLRDWLESRLPANLAALDAASPGLEAQLSAELWRAGLLAPENVEGAGYVSKLKLSRPGEYPGALVVQAGISVPCASDESVYVYHFSNTRTRLVETHGTGKWDSSVLESLFSNSDAYGNHIFYASWYGVQCGSVWNGVEYQLFRIDTQGEHALPLFSANHTFVIDNDVNVKLTSEELLLELTAEAMEGGFRRTYVLRYRIGPDQVERIDPVALQPQDFVHEWLIRPWSEMQSRSSEAMEKWHSFLEGDLVFGEYEFVQPCIDSPGVTQVGVGVINIGERDIPEPLSVYFLVRDNGEHRYEMLEISFDRQEGCPGETQADYDNPPSLFKPK
jgi:hypothetical protein